MAKLRWNQTPEGKERQSKILKAKYAAGWKAQREKNFKKIIRAAVKRKKSKKRKSSRPGRPVGSKNKITSVLIGNWRFHLLGTEVRISRASEIDDE
jgi:hypothetical protein